MSQDSDIVEYLAAFSNDPLGFVLACFPWGEAETELENDTGPEPWQVELLTKIRDGLLTAEGAIQEATASGHGIGKSAFVSWILWWAVSTMEDTKGVVTANTETQLKTKTWAEVAKWYRLFIGKSLFHMTATAVYSVDPEHERTWRIDMVPWSERNTEAFAGLHNKGRRILLIFDEASAIPDMIWEVAEGALTDKDTQILWLVFGNPTKNGGRFKECFTRFAHRWGTRAIDSRSVSFTDKDQINKWIKDYGDDSDFVRIRVKGQFPRAGSMQFIPGDLVEEACYREVESHRHDPFIIGVDVARFGDDESVILFRKGRDARSIPPLRFQGVDTMTLAGRVSEAYMQYRADAIFVDGGGVGGGVIDRLRQLLKGAPVFEVQFGAKADRGNAIGEAEYALYANKRAEIWGSMKDWLKGGAIPNEQEWRAQLTAPEYGFNARNEILLESKQDMKKRGATSPDIADALALTFSLPVIPSAFAGGDGPHKPLLEVEYDPMELELA